MVRMLTALVGWSLLCGAAVSETTSVGFDFIRELDRAEIVSPRVDTVYEEVLSGTWERIVSGTSESDTTLWRQKLELPMAPEWLLLSVESNGKELLRDPDLAPGIAAAWPEVPPVLPSWFVDSATASKEAPVSSVVLPATAEQTFPPEPSDISYEILCGRVEHLGLDEVLYTDRILSRHIATATGDARVELTGHASPVAEVYPFVTLTLGRNRTEAFSWVGRERTLRVFPTTVKRPDWSFRLAWSNDALDLEEYQDRNLILTGARLRFPSWIVVETERADEPPRELRLRWAPKGFLPRNLESPEHVVEADAGERRILTESLVRVVTLEEVSRLSLLLTSPSSLAYAGISVPPKALLHWSYGVPTDATPELRGSFVIRAAVRRSGTKTWMPLEETWVSAREAERVNAWTSASASLERWAYQEIDVLFETEQSLPSSRPFRYEGVGCPADVALGSPRMTVPAKPESKTPERPDLILVSLDTLRADHLGCYGYDKPTSPAIDAFADEAVLFESAYSTTHWTLSAHASLFTGLYESQHGVKTAFHRIPDSLPVLAELLREAGYQTGGFVDGFLLRREFGLNRGFDEYDSRAGGLENILPRALTWLDGLDRSRPVFLFVHTYDIHDPYGSGGKYLGRFGFPKDAFRDALRPTALHDLVHRQLAEGAEEEPPHLVRSALGLYDADIRYADDYVGELLEALRERGMFEGSLIVILSDHGEEFGEHPGCWGHRKSLYRQATHVPMLIKRPNEPEKGRRRAEVVSLIDVLPTTLGLLGALFDEPRPGLDLFGPIPDDRVVYSESHHNDLISATSKDVRAILQREAPGLVRLYDPRFDSGDLADFAPHEPRLRETWIERLKEADRDLREGIDGVRKTEEVPADLDEDFENALRNIGYLE